MIQMNFFTKHNQTHRHRKQTHGYQRGREREGEQEFWIKITHCMCAKSLQSCLTLCDTMNHSPPGSSVHGILQERILEWVAVPSSRDIPNSGIEPASLICPALAGRFFTTSKTWEAQNIHTATAAAAAASLQSCLTLCNSIDGSLPGFPSLGFSRQEHWSGLPFPSPMHESEK